MGTRGILGFVIDGQVKATYNHFDSYPSYLGVKVLDYVKGIKDRAALAEQIKALKVVDQMDKPDADTLAQLVRDGFADTGVSTGTDWYAALRNTQGDVDAIVRSGYLTDSGEFWKDSLFCEWGYLINLDEGTLEVYKGFQTAYHRAGRFAQRKPANWKPPYKGAEFYYPIALVGTFPFDTDVSHEEFISTLEPESVDA